MGLKTMAVPTFQELVKDCDKGRVAEEVSRRRAGRGARGRASLRNAINAGARMMLDEACSLERVDECAFVAVLRIKFSPLEEDCLVRHVEAVYLDREGHEGPRSSISELPRNEAIGCGVWFGGGSLMSDRYELLADICWSLMVNGPRADEADARAAMGVESAGASSGSAWMARVSNQWNLEMPDYAQRERAQELKGCCDVLNKSAEARFLSEVLELQKYLRMTSVGVDASPDRLYSEGSTP